MAHATNVHELTELAIAFEILMQHDALATVMPGIKLRELNGTSIYPLYSMESPSPGFTSQLMYRSDLGDHRRIFIFGFDPLAMDIFDAAREFRSFLTWPA